VSSAVQTALIYSTPLVTWLFEEDKLTQFAPTGDGDPLASLNAELEEIKANAEEMTERLRAASRRCGGRTAP
jgi:hypothetical protein